MKSRFLPNDYDQILFRQYHCCAQKGRRVTEYTDEFYRLSSRNNLQENERQQWHDISMALVCQFKKNLKSAPFGALMLL